MNHPGPNHTPMRGHTGWALLAIGLLSASMPSWAEEPAATPKPSIVIFLADDLGYADVGVQGCRDIPTPHIDSIAKNGVRFTDAYANHPVCSPSRAALMSGRYQHRFGFEHNSGPERYAAENFGLPRDEPTLAERLKPLGYATGMVGKWHIGFKEGLRPRQRGFDFHYGFLSGAHTYLPGGRDADPIVRNDTPVTDEKEYLTDAFAREAVSFIDRSKERPFFLYMAFNAVHAPLEATAKYERRFASITDPKRRTYAGMLSAMDDAVGRVLAKLNEIGQDENTLVFFYSDNGGPTPQTTSRNDPLRGYKGQVLEGGIRVPFLMQCKGRLPGGRDYVQPVAGFDVHATALAAAGGAFPTEKPLDGVDLLPFLTGLKSGAPHDRLFWRAGPQAAVRMGDWKLVSARGEAPQLFNLRDDIGESKDRARAEPEKLAELRAAYRAWDAQMMPAQWVRQDAGTARRQPPATGGQRPAADGPGGALRSAIEQRYRQLDADRDGTLSAEEGEPLGALFDRADADRDGFLTPSEATRYFQNPANRLREGVFPPVDLDSVPATPIPPPEKPGEPSLKPLLDSDAVRDAAGRGQLFESIHVAGLTTIREGMNGLAIADLNRDGRLDIVATFSPPRGQGADTFGQGEKLRVLLNEGGFRFREHAITLRDSKQTLDNFGRGQVPNLADFNGDGFLDIFVTRHAPMAAGQNRRGIESPGNSLYLSDGAWDRFRDVSDAMGIRNEQAYNRQPSIGDVNRDGWLDIAIGCDNIGNAQGGFPHSRLYVFRPQGSQFADGHFEDIGGTDLVPDFGGFHHDSARDKAGPNIALRDADNDGDLDLFQTCHVDVREPLLPYSPGEYRQGVFCWRNLLVETGTLTFEKLTGNGLACESRLAYNREKQVYEPASDAMAPGLPYLVFADVDNDGLQDAFATGPSDSTWSPRVEYVGGRFWKNLGGLRFEEATKDAGLDAINNTYRQWYDFFGVELLDFHRNYRPYARNALSQPGMTPPNPIDNRPYYADAIFGDFDNDGWQDLVVLDRRESGRIETRAILFRNRGDGTFRPEPTTYSGLDSGGISGEAADLNDDGLLDLVFAADPDNTGLATDPRRYESRVYWNNGEHGARTNHWLRLRFTGVKDAELIGARVVVIEPGTGKRLGTRVIAANHSYKSGGALETHFGLGRATTVDVAVTLLGGRSRKLDGIAVDRIHDITIE